MADIYRGSVVSKMLGLLSAIFLASSIWALFTADWLALFIALGVSALTAYGGYRAAGGRHNPELAKAAWERQHHIDVVSLMNAILRRFQLSRDGVRTASSYAFRLPAECSAR